MRTSSGRNIESAASLVTVGLIAGYGGPPVISEIAIRADAGEIVTLIGPNGAGKSTLVKTVVGLLKPESGTIRLGDRDITRLSCEQRARAGIGYVPQVDDVFATLTVRENLELGAYTLARRERGEHVKSAASLFPNLEPLMNRLAGKLSGGERKVLAMARALVPRPQLLVLDEPTAGLSPELSRRLFEEHIRRLADAGVAILMVEQKAMAALAISDRGYVLAGGQVRIAGLGSELLARPDVAELYLGRVGRAGPTEFSGAPDVFVGPVTR